MRYLLSLARATLFGCAIAILLAATTSAMDIGRETPPFRSAEVKSKVVTLSKARATNKKRIETTSGRLVGTKRGAGKLKHGTSLGSAKKSKVKTNKKLSEKELRQCFEGGGGACMVSCLANSVPLDTIITCAEACGSGQWGTCATCIGVGIEVVVACGLECLFEFQ